MKERLDEFYGDLSVSERTFDEDDVMRTLSEVFKNIYGASSEIIEKPGKLNALGTAFAASKAAFVASAKLVTDGYARSEADF